jgi:hypothetical protein
MSYMQRLEDLNRLSALSAEKMTPGMSIVGPWSDEITPLERAETHMKLLAATYGKGHPGSAGDIESMLARQQTNQMLTWIVNWNNFPVGMVNLEVQERGIAEAVRSVSLPKGTRLPDGTIYDGQANISAAMYRRIPDLLSEPDFSETLWAIEGDVRLAAEIKLPTNEILPSGVRTQHINHQSGLRPYLLVVPRYRVHPDGGVPHQETFLQSRLYLQNNDTTLDEPIYTPLQHPLGKKNTIAGIVQATYEFAHDIEPTIIDESGNLDSYPTYAGITPTAGIHFSTIELSGDVEKSHIQEMISSGLAESRFVEIILPNRPENIQLQRDLMALGLMPLGVFPGGTFLTEQGQQTIETTIHFGIARPEVVRQMVKVSCATDYQGSQLEKVIHSLRNEWREHE